MQEKFCLFFRKNINNYLQNNLNYNDIRKFIYHLDNCKECYEILLEEYILYIISNNLDDTTTFNYDKMLQLKIEETKKSILTNDNIFIIKYIFYSIVIIVFIVYLLVFCIRKIYL